MLGAAGCIAPEALGKMGVIPEATQVIWWQSGVIGPATTYDNYWTDAYSLFLIEVVLMQFAELKRLQDFRCVVAGSCCGRHASYVLGFLPACAWLGAAKRTYKGSTQRDYKWVLQVDMFSGHGLLDGFSKWVNMSTGMFQPSAAAS